MAEVADTDPQHRILFTAPWEPVVVRRGDALGLRALADQFADAVAPDLSNRVRDGRWVTILAWCLVRSHAVFHAGGGRSITTRTEQRARYAWLRPLELMWVARTISLAVDDWRDRSLSGQRRVAPWNNDHDRATDRFGMSEDQFRAYRQTGMYGGYRLAFRKWPGMTLHGEGWRPGPATNQLAKWLDAKLGAARPEWPLHVGEGDERRFPTPDKRSLGKEHEWWLRKWRAFAKGGKSADENTLPRGKRDFAVLPEGDLLKPLVFGKDVNGKRRGEVACEVAKASAANHLQVCEHLGRVFNDPIIKLLPRFSRLADAGMAAMELIAKSLRNASRVELADVAKVPDAARICDELMVAAQEWNKNSEMSLRHIDKAHRFASAIPNARPIECLRSLLQHHEVYGGGLRWFVLRNGWVELRTPQRTGSSGYRFRLWSLCRLATQCGVLGKPPALLGDDESEADETVEAADE